MQNSVSTIKNPIRVRVLAILIAVALSLALPQVFHYAGMVSGLGAGLGAAFLPMHLPVFLAGLIAGPIVGLISGLISPVLSFVISGMPTVTMLPFMTIELACYGLACGLLKRVKMPVILKVLSAQVIARLVRAAAVLIAFYGFSANGVTLAQTYNIVLIGLPGIMLQWAIIPLFIYRFKGLKKYYE